MGKTVLFSPVGMRDPISKANAQDGAMLHLCRHEYPDEVYLYMTKETYDREEEDHRYSYCLDELMKLQNREFTYKFVGEGIKEVFLFENFYDEFISIISDIISHLDISNGDRLLINVSSGTPQMQSTLYAATTVLEYPCELLQVRAPHEMQQNKSMDTPRISNLKKLFGYDDAKTTWNVIPKTEKYDVHHMWMNDSDNEENSRRRIIEVKTEPLTILTKERIIKSLVEKYEYTAALEVARGLPEYATENYINELIFADARYRQIESEIEKVPSNKCSETVRYDIGALNALGEYFLVWKIKYERERLTDFVRGFSPLFKELLLVILDGCCNFNYKEYIYRRNTGMEVWDGNKIESMRSKDENAKKLYLLLYDSKKNKIKPEIYSDDLRNLIVDNIDVSKTRMKKKNLLDTLEKLREFEKYVRNSASHELSSLDSKENAESFSKYLKGVETIMEFGCGVQRTSEQWKQFFDSFKTMNDIIIKSVQSHD